MALAKGVQRFVIAICGGLVSLFACKTSPSQMIGQAGNGASPSPATQPIKGESPSTHMKPEYGVSPSRYMQTKYGVKPRPQPPERMVKPLYGVNRPQPIKKYGVRPPPATIKPVKRKSYIIHKLAGTVKDQSSNNGLPGIEISFDHHRTFTDNTGRWEIEFGNYGVPGNPIRAKVQDVDVDAHDNPADNKGSFQTGSHNINDKNPKNTREFVNKQVLIKMYKGSRPRITTKYGIRRKFKPNKN